MDDQRFDDLARLLAATRSRRRALRALAAGAVGPALTRHGLGEGAAREATGHPGCAHAGERCKRGSQCCSGVCRRKRRTGAKVCRPAPNQGTCTIERDRCNGDASACGTDQGFDCRCYVTTAGRSLCGRDQFYCLAGNACATNADCAAVIGAGAACVRGGEACSDAASCATFCVMPCANPDPNRA